MNELDEFLMKAYESSALYKEKMKKYHDQKIEKRDFMVGDLVLLFNSRLRLLSGKLKSKWTGPYMITQLFPHGAVELENKEGVSFKVNEQRIKLYLGHAETAKEVIETYHLDEVCVIKSPPSCRDVKSSADWEDTQYVSSSKL